VLKPAPLPSSHTIRVDTGKHMTEIHQLTVISGEQRQILTVAHGANLRQTLLDNGFSPYAALTRRLNCGGNGLCATCGVWLEQGAGDPEHWHDHLAAAFGYPRLSCQISITGDLTVRLLSDKRIWGDRDPARARRWRGER
jgi:ferredoxin